MTDSTKPCGSIHYYAQGDVTCYVIRGKHGDLLIDTGMPYIWDGLRRWLMQYRIRHLFLTHAHVDHDWNTAKLQRAGVKVLLCERDRMLRQNRLRNYTQLIGGTFFTSPPYDADLYFGKHDRDLLRRLGYPADIILLPGHTYGSAGVLSNGVLYCGDAFTGLWKKPDITPHAVSPELMRRSLERIVKLSPEWLACGHGLPMRFEEAYPVIEHYLRNCT